MRWPDEHNIANQPQVRERVSAAIRDAIFEFRLAPGDRLKEREIVEQLDVSRTTVREALRELAADGLVTIAPKRGAIVAKPSADEANDLYEVRAALESMVVERFVERASASEIIRLDAAVEHFAEITMAGSGISEILTAKDEFYGVLIAGARSDVLRQMLEGIQARVRILRATSLSAAGRSDQAVSELRAIVRAVKDGDGQRAAALCADHVHTAKKTAVTALINTADQAVS